MTVKHWLRDFVLRNLTEAQYGRLREFMYHRWSIVRIIQTGIWRRINIGNRTYVDPTAHFLGLKNISVGNDCIISEHCYFNVNYRHGHDVAIEIGNYSFIGRRNFFSSGKRIRLGSYALTGIDCRFLSSGHVFSNPMEPYIATGTTHDNEIDIGVNCWIGTGVTILGNIKVGHGCVIGAGAFVLTDIPAFSLAIGSPARVIKRYDVRREEWVNAEKFSEEQAALLPDEQHYLERLRAARPHIQMPRPAAGRAWGHLP